MSDPTREALRSDLAAMPVILSMGDDGEPLVSRDLMLEIVDDLLAALPTTPAPSLTTNERAILARMRGDLDLGRYTAYRADDVRALLDIIDRLEGAPHDPE